MKRRLVALFVSGCLLPAAAHSGEFGCRVLLCLAAPAGPTSVHECRPTIRKLWEDLLEGKPFPTCEFASAPDSSLGVRHGREFWYPCEEGYTLVAGGHDDGWAAYTPISTGQWAWGRNVLCRKLAGYREVGEGGFEPLYDRYPAHRRREDRWVEVRVDGQPQGERFYYRVKKK